MGQVLTPEEQRKKNSFYDLYALPTFSVCECECFFCFVMCFFLKGIVESISLILKQNIDLKLRY